MELNVENIKKILQIQPSCNIDFIVITSQVVINRHVILKLSRGWRPNTDYISRGVEPISGPEGGVATMTHTDAPPQSVQP